MWPWNAAPVGRGDVERCQWASDRQRSAKAKSFMWCKWQSAVQVALDDAGLNTSRSATGASG
jgi:hypothetical protein